MNSILQCRLFLKALSRPNLSKFFRITLLIGILLLPFVFNTKGFISHEIPKVYFFNRWSEILMLTALIYVWKEKDKLSILLPTLLTAYVATAFLSSFLGVDLIKSLYGNFYRDDGLLTLLHLLGFALAVNLVWQPQWRLQVIKVLGASSVLLSILIFASITININQIHSILSKGIGSTFGNPNFLAGYLLITLPFTLFEASRLKTKFWIWGAVLQLLGILATKSLAGIIGLFFLAFLILWRKFNYSKKVLVLAGLIIIALSVVWGWQYWRYYHNPTDPGLINTRYEGRERILTKGVLAFLKKPLTGWGWSNFDKAFQAVEWPIKYKHDVYVDKAHMALLEIMVTTGVLGTVIYLMIVGYGIRKLWTWRKTKTGSVFLSSFLLFLFHSQTNIISINEEMVFWLILGIAIKASEEESKPGSVSLSRKLS